MKREERFFVEFFVREDAPGREFCFVQVLILEERAGSSVDREDLIGEKFKIRTCFSGFIKSLSMFSFIFGEILNFLTDCCSYFFFLITVTRMFNIIDYSNNSKYSGYNY